MANRMALKLCECIVMSESVKIIRFFISGGKEEKDAQVSDDS